MRPFHHLGRHSSRFFLRGLGGSQFFCDVSTHGPMSTHLRALYVRFDIARFFSSSCNVKIQDILEWCKVYDICMIFEKMCLLLANNYCLDFAGLSFQFKEVSSFGSRGDFMQMLLDLQKSFDLDTKNREDIDNHNLIERSCMANPCYCPWGVSRTLLFVLGRS